MLLVEDNVTLCNRSASETHLMGDSSSSVEFFVAVAVLAFLYCMVALLVYVGYMHVYHDSNFGPVFVSMSITEYGLHALSIPYTSKRTWCFISVSVTCRIFW